MKTLGRLLRRRKPTDAPPRPWLGGESICAYLRSQIDPQTGRLRDSTIALPDAKVHSAAQEGAPTPEIDYESVGESGAVSRSRELADACITLVKTIAKTDDESAKAELYRILQQDALLDELSFLTAKVSEMSAGVYPYLHGFVTTLAEHAPDRGAVKAALALLGVIGNPADRALITLLGRHEEFTLYAATALSNLSDAPEPALWELAQSVSGWGRIHIVEQLATTPSPAIKRWLLRDGYHTRVMPGYLAYICATAGNLKDALEVDTIDGELLDATGEILEALIAGGHAEDIDDYDDAAAVISRYLAHLQRQAHTLRHMVVAYSLQRYLDDPGWDTKRRWQRGWTQTTRRAALKVAQQIVVDPRWPAQIDAGLRSDDDGAFDTASHAASALGIPTWPLHWTRLERKPEDPVRWSSATEAVSADEMPHLVAYALRVLPLSQAAGPESPVHRCLEPVVRALAAFPSLGGPLLAAALRSPVLRLRRDAVNTLDAWGREAWSPEILTALTAAHDSEPDSDIQQRIGTMLRDQVSR